MTLKQLNLVTIYFESPQTNIFNHAEGGWKGKISVPYSQGNNLFSPNVRPCKEQREVFAQMSFFSALKLSLMNL